MLTRTLIAFTIVLVSTTAASALEPIEPPVSSAVLLIAVLVLLAGTAVTVVGWRYLSAFEQLFAQRRTEVSDENAENAYRDPHG